MPWFRPSDRNRYIEFTTSTGRLVTIEGVMLFAKNLQKADSVRRYTIKTTPRGWEVREEQNSDVVRQACYQDWHRVERARRAFVIQVDSLREAGWQEV